MVAYSTCLAVRLPSRFCASSLASTSRLFSGVRSSWDMLARNCDLYRRPGPAAWRALDLLPGLLDLAFLVSMSRFCAAAGRLVGQLGVGPLQFLCRLQLRGQPLRLVEQRVGAGVGDHRVDVDADGLHQLLEEVAVHLGERPQRPGLDDAEHLVLEHDRHDHHVDRAGLADRRGDADVARRDLVQHDRLAGLGDLADQRLDRAAPGRASRRRSAARTRRSAAAGSRRLAGLGEEERAVLPADQRDELVHDQLGDRPPGPAGPASGRRSAPGWSAASLAAGWPRWSRAATGPSC